LEKSRISSVNDYDRQINTPVMQKNVVFIFYFWGHSYELMDCPQFWERFDLMIKTLSEDPDVEWVDVIDLVPLCKGAK